MINFKKRGFIQLALLIVIVLVISTTTTAGYLGLKYLKLNKQARLIETIETEKKSNITSEKITNTQFKLNKQVLSSILESSTPKTNSNLLIQQKEDIKLKIEKCKAVKENTYNNAILKLNQITNARLEEIFNSLDQQYKNEVKKINDDTNAKISSLTGDYILFYSQYYNDSALEKLENLYENQQTFWKTQKREVENAKQKGIDQINLLLSEEYNKCLAK